MISEIFFNIIIYFQILNSFKFQFYIFIYLKETFKRGGNKRTVLN